MSQDLLETITVTRRMTKFLGARGLPKNLSDNKPFELEPTLSTFISEGGKFKDKRYSKKKQVDFLARVFDDPFFGPYTFCIAGAPHDMQAKMLAAVIMYQATNKHTDRTKTPPRWETVYSGFDNKTMRDTFDPSMLILSNLTIDSSNQKIDKARDALEKHSNIPRVVVVAGCDPLEFFNTRLYYNLNGCIYLQGKQVVRYGEESKKSNTKNKSYNTL